MRTLREGLQEWAPVDVAAHELGVLIGIVRDPQGSFRSSQHVVWAESDAGTALRGVVAVLVERGILEADDDDEPGAVRFNPAFDAWWEREGAALQDD